MIQQPKERTVKVIRSFIHKGQPTEVGKSLVLPNDFAHEMRHSGKVEFIDPDPVPVKTEQPAPNAIPASTPRETPKGK